MAVVGPSTRYVESLLQTFGLRVSACPLRWHGAHGIGPRHGAEFRAVVGHRHTVTCERFFATDCGYRMLSRKTDLGAEDALALHLGRQLFVQGRCVGIICGIGVVEYLGQLPRIADEVIVLGPQQLPAIL
jgi:hypothetical protein